MQTSQRSKYHLNFVQVLLHFYQNNKHPRVRITVVYIRTAYVHHLLFGFLQENADVRLIQFYFPTNEIHKNWITEFDKLNKSWKYWIPINRYNRDMGPHFRHNNSRWQRSRIIDLVPVAFAENRIQQRRNFSVRCSRNGMKILRQ